MRSTIRSILVAVAACVLVSGGVAFAAIYKDISQFRHIRHTLTGDGANGAGTTWQASADITVAELHAGNFFKVGTTAGAVDLDFANDVPLDAADVGSTWTFCVDEGGTNALTVTACASGVETMKAIDLKGTTCEDVGDCITVIAYSTTQGSAVTSCAD